jgi:hypothetical protein
MYCRHAYAHATSTAKTTLPFILKGSDMIAYEVFLSLGIRVYVRPVADHIGKHQYEPDQSSFRKYYHVGKEFSQPWNTHMECGESYTIEEVYEDYPSDLLKVTWMNWPIKGNREVQFGYTAVSQPFSAFSFDLTDVYTSMVTRPSPRSNTASVHSSSRFLRTLSVFR